MSSTPSSGFRYLRSSSQRSPVLKSGNTSTNRFLLAVSSYTHAMTRSPSTASWQKYRSSLARELAKIPRFTTSRKFNSYFFLALDPRFVNPRTPPHFLLLCSCVQTSTPTSKYGGVGLTLGSLLSDPRNLRVRIVRRLTSSSCGAAPRFHSHTVSPLSFCVLADRQSCHVDCLVRLHCFRL